MTTNRTAEGSLYHTLPLLHCFEHLHVAQCRAGLGSPGTGQRSRTGRSNGSLAAPPGARSDGRWGVWGGEGGRGGDLALGLRGRETLALGIGVVAGVGGGGHVRVPVREGREPLRNLRRRLLRRQHRQAKAFTVHPTGAERPHLERNICRYLQI